MNDQTFASFPQRAFWLLNEVEPGTPASNLVRAFRIAGPLNYDLLTDAFALLLQRHRSLRTSFTEADGEVWQCVEDQVSVDIERRDLSDLPEQEREPEALKVAAELGQASFDLRQAPLLRVSLLRLGPQWYVLVLVLHHIIVDGWSMALLFDELAELYEALLNRRDPQLADLPVEYTDYSVWQRKYLTEGDYKRDLEYWKEALRDAPSFLELPTDYSRPEVRSHHGSRVYFGIDPDSTSRLKAIFARKGATLFMGLLTTFQILLHRYSGADDIVVGTPVAGRHDPALSNLIGCFVNTLVMRGDLSGDPSFEELLTRTRASTLSAFEHQEFPFDHLIAELHPKRARSRAPVFQVMMIFHNTRKQTPCLRDVMLEEIRFDSGLSRADLTLELAESGGWLSCSIEYSTDLFKRPTIERMARHFQTLIVDAMSNPATAISSLRILDDNELEEITVKWNDTKIDYPRDLTVGRAFEEQAKLTPDKIAFIEGARQITYQELDRQADQVAHQLRSLGVRSGDPVGIYAPRSLETMAALLGTLKVGAPFVPLDTSQPAARLQSLVQNARCEFVLTRSAIADRLPDPVRPVLLDPEAELWTTKPTPGTTFDQADQLAYIIFTSGSTGVPKGVMGTHRAIINRCAWADHAYPFKPGEVCCQKTAIGFVDSIWETFGPLLRGVPSVIIPNEHLIDPERLVEVLRQAHVSRIVLVPTLLRVLLNQLPDLGSRLPELAMRSISGEYLPLDLARSFHRSCPGALLLNIYGSSEVAADATSYPVLDTNELTTVPIGRPISNTQVYILGAQSEPVPIGVPGLIHVGGDGLSPGYYLREDLTQERFIANPITRAPSKRLFNTGDRGRFLADGNIEFLGRADDQTKVHGIRIEPGEIEANLLAHSQVSKVAVLASGSATDTHLIAFVVGVNGSLPPELELRTFLRGRLPEYMVPNFFVELEHIPVLPSGKIDRVALLARFAQRPARDRSSVAPRTDIEHGLLPIWRDLLDVSDISTQDDFFDLGGNSLLAIQIIARIRKHFDVDISVRTLFDNANIVDLGAEIEKAKLAGKKARPQLQRRPTARRHIDALRAELMRMSPEEAASYVQAINEVPSDE